MAAFRLTSAALALALALAACGEANQEQPAGLEEARVPPLPSGAEQPAFVREHIRTRNPYWVTLAQQTGGGAVQYAPETILRYPAQRTATVSTQILHGSSQSESFESTEAIETITFQREQNDFILDCAKRQFAITDRRLMEDSEAVARSIEYVADGAEVPWRPIAEGSVASVIFGPACEAE